MKDLKIVYINIDKLKPAEYNPRKADQKQIDDIKKSIQRFGLVDPLIVNSAKERKNVVIGGHLRLKVAKDMGYKEIPVVYVNIPDIEKEKELNIRLNKNTGEFDYDLLANFDEKFLLDVGFLNEELTDIFDLETQDDNFDFEKEVNKIEKPKTKIRDKYQLGEHYLLCGDSTKIKDVEKLMENKKCNIVITDPPYNIGLDYSKTLSGRKVSYDKKINDNKSVEDYEEFINKLIVNSLAVCNPDAHIFYWCDEKYIWLFQKLFMGNNIKLQRVCLWIKNNFSPTPQMKRKCYMIEYNETYCDVIIKRWEQLTGKKAIKVN